ncbi:MAG: SDR family NAD(P)-dependent oxidoreductase, partial [Rhodanobacteraceae bacterium]
MDLDLSGKHALVCGASHGIGRAAAHELAALGADVTVLARSRDTLETVA